MIRRLALVAALAAVALLLVGCRATLEVNVDVNRDGRGSVTLRLALDAAAQQAIGLSPSEDPDEAAARFLPLLADGGWSGGDGQIAATRDDETGELVLETRHQIESTDQLDDVLSYPRRLDGLAPDAATLVALTDLPADGAPAQRLRLPAGRGQRRQPGLRPLRARRRR